MRVKTIGWAVMALLGLGSAVAQGADPVPLWKLGDTTEPAAFKRLIKATDQRQFGCSVSVQFEKPGFFAGKDEAAKWHDFGFFQLRINAEQLLEAKFLPERDEIRALPLVLTSTDKIEYGVSYDLALNFSAEKRRYSMYLNGKWQMDNAVPHVPDRIRATPPALQDFPGKVYRFIVYDMALNAEELTPFLDEEKALADYAARANRLAQSENAALAAWGQEIAHRLDRQAIVSIASRKRDVNDLEKAETLAAVVGTNQQAFVAYRVNPTSQEMYLPSKLPQDGEIAESLRFIAAQGENTFGSVVVVPLKTAKAFTVRFTPLKAKSGAAIPADRIETKLVKCWFRSGGAWLAYQSDKLTRVLAPDLLLNDEKVVRVDEHRQSNERLLHLPEGPTYIDCSRNGQDQHEFYMQGEKTKIVPFRDAKTLQPVAMDEVGRSQQYLFTFLVPENQPAGFYHGGLELVADGKVVRTLPVTFRVLPFVLPPARTYYDLDRTYFSHINLCWGKNRFPIKPQYEVLAKYGFRHPSNILDSRETYQWAKETGMDMANIMSAPADGPGAWAKPWGGNARDLPDEALPKLDRLFLENWERKSKDFKDLIKDAVLYPVFTSEQDHWRATKEEPDRPENVYHVYTNVKRFSHSMTEKFILGALDGTDMDSSAQIHREWADIWHAAGARVINYAEPFPSSENPAWFRRKLGLELYKTGYDGHMMHGFLSMRWNEFTDWPEDPAYRNFGMAYYGDEGIVERLCLVGCAEGYNDVRYATKLRMLCRPALESKDPVIVKEAKRQLAWLETVDGIRYDMTAFRQGCVHRILTMLELQAARKEVK